MTVKPPKAELICSDLDGTLIHAPQNSKVNGERVFVAELARQLRLNNKKVDVRFQQAKAKVALDPTIYGLRSPDGRLASCVSDALIHMSCAGYLTRDGLAPEKTADEWFALVQNAFRTAYASMYFALKEDAATYLQTIHQRRSTMRFRIPTNAAHDISCTRLQKLTSDKPALNWIVNSVIGDARKFYITDNDVPSVPASINIPGLYRPVYLRRGHYFRAVDTVRAQCGNPPWDKVMIIGDIAELDLMMFASLGAQVVLVQSAATLPHEKDYITSLPNGRVVNKLTELL